MSLDATALLAILRFLPDLKEYRLVSKKFDKIVKEVRFERKSERNRWLELPKAKKERRGSKGSSSGSSSDRSGGSGRDELSAIRMADIPRQLRVLSEQFFKDVFRQIVLRKDIGKKNVESFISTAMAQADRS